MEGLKGPKHRIFTLGIYQETPLNTALELKIKVMTAKYVPWGITCGRVESEWGEER
jgi:hypothetical protein